MNITKETKWHTSCRCHGNSYAAGPVLIKVRIPRFSLKQGSSIPNVLIIMGRVKTIWEWKTLCTTCKCYKWRFLLFHRKRLEPRVLPWQQHSRCRFASVVMFSPGAKFKEHCSIISRDIVDWVLYCFSRTIYDVITFLICITQKRNISMTKKGIPKRKTPFFFTLKNLFK